jgi:hypothetical protein
MVPALLCVVDLNVIGYVSYSSMLVSFQSKKKIKGSNRTKTRLRVVRDRGSRAPGEIA